MQAAATAAEEKQMSIDPKPGTEPVIRTVGEGGAPPIHSIKTKPEERRLVSTIFAFLSWFRCHLGCKS